jgi:uncharacterized protein with HEPN domain
MRPDCLFLRDIVDAADAIVKHIAGRAVIGEAAARVSAELRQRQPEIPWPEIIGFRNVVIHEYFGLSWPIIWITATEDVPDLRGRIEAILRDESAEATD